jgi:hypothetical protein
MSRFVRPNADVLTISDGDTLVVRRRLNTGEQRAMFQRMRAAASNGDGYKVDPMQVGLATMTAYLLDWSLRDDTGAPVVIRDQPIEAVESAINALDPEDFAEIREAIETHVARIDAARAEEKKTRSGGVASSPTSTSPAAAAGGTNG